MATLLQYRVMALRQIEPRLTRLKLDKDQGVKEWLIQQLLESGEVDHRSVAADAVETELLERETAFDSLFELADQVVELAHGIPVCRDNTLWNRLVRDLDADLVIAAYLAGCRSPQDSEDLLRELSWPSILAQNGFIDELVTRRELVDSHVHLGGALPPSYYWVSTMCDSTSPHHMKGWDPDMELWPAHIRDAIEWRKWFCEQWLQLACSGNSVEEDYRAQGDALPHEPFVDPLLRAMAAPSQRLSLNPVLGERYLLWLGLYEVRHGWWIGKMRDDFMNYMKVRNSFINLLSYKGRFRGLDDFGQTMGRQRQLLRYGRARRPLRPRGESPRERRIRENIESSRRRAKRLERAFLIGERFRLRHALRYQFSDPTDAPWARDSGFNLTPPGPEASQAEQLLFATTQQPQPWRPIRQLELRINLQQGRIQPRVLHAYLMGFEDFLRLDRDATPLRLGLCFQLRREGLEHDLNLDNWLKSMVNLLRERPGLRPFVVGFDAAGSSEIKGPPRNLSAFYHKVLEADRRQEPLPGSPPMRLRRTCHAGEDFRDLLTGLRFIHDAIDLLELQPGERIGHGLALGFLPERWYETHPLVQKLLKDHLLDLVWCMRMAEPFSGRIRLERDGTLRDLAYDFLRETLAREKGLKCPDSSFLGSWCSDYADARSYPTEAALLEHFGFGELARQASGKGKLHEIRHDPLWVRLVAQVRARLLAIVNAREIVIEACPTSNLTIARLSNYAELPYLEMTRRGLSSLPPLKYPLLLSLNSDDPGNFHTTIANEFRQMARALHVQGHHPLDIEDWLEAARRVGVASTFIPPWSPPSRWEILEALKHLWRR